MKKLAAAYLGIFLLLAIPAAAHHSMAGFDRKNPVTLTGVVKNFSWQNPHCYIELDVPGKNGETVTWNVEMTAPGYLARAGWKKTDVKPGDKVTVVADPLLTGEPGALFVSITLASGEKLTQRGREPAPAKGQ
ncbi:MAG TPA: DUF6152 family protein [Bryobacteraceae bacterium]|jgi:hypothetical protein